MKAAVTFLAPSMVTRQVPVPAQAPPHPEKVEPPPGAAESVTGVPVTNAWEAEVQAASHEMPAGDDVTVPAPFFDTVSV